MFCTLLSSTHSSYPVPNSVFTAYRSQVKIRAVLTFQLYLTESYKVVFVMSILVLEQLHSRLGVTDNAFSSKMAARIQ